MLRLRKIKTVYKSLEAAKKTEWEFLLFIMSKTTEIPAERTNSGCKLETPKPSYRCLVSLAYCRNVPATKQRWVPAALVTPRLSSQDAQAAKIITRSGSLICNLATSLARDKTRQPTASLFFPLCLGRWGCPSGRRWYQARSDEWVF